jgi:hypothetical protein
VIISNSAHILARVTGDKHHLSPSNTSRRETRISVRTAGRAHRAWHKGSQLYTVQTRDQHMRSMICFWRATRVPFQTILGKICASFWRSNGLHGVHSDMMAHKTWFTEKNLRGILEMLLNDVVERKI